MHIFKRINNNLGFTLVELLLVVVIIFLIIASVCGSLVGGVKLFHRINGITQDREVEIFSKQLFNDITNLNSSRLLPFEPDVASIKFAKVQVLESPTKSWDSRPVYISYDHDVNENLIRRIEYIPGTALYDPVERESIILRNVDTFEIHYDGIESGLPKNVLINMSYKSEFGNKSIRLEIPVPAISFKSQGSS